MRLDKTGLAMMLAIFFACKLFYHLFMASIYFIVYEFVAMTIFIANKTHQWYNAKYRGIY